VHMHIAVLAVSISSITIYPGHH